MAQLGHVLIVDDDGDYAHSLVRALKNQGVEYSINIATDPDAALTVAQQEMPQVAIVDLVLKPSEGVRSGLALISKLLASDPTCRIIVLTGHGHPEYGIKALSLGAANFLTKPPEIAHLKALLIDAVDQAKLRRSYQKLLDNQQTHSLLIGDSREMQNLRQQIKIAASTTQSVLLTGETGTGKGVCARVIHESSPRKSERFIRYQPNFGTADLTASELFGHRAGAFTGAVHERRGLISEANNGTLFLDEVDELPRETQVTLLHVLQEKQFRRLGSDREEDATFRLISASNQDIDRCVAEGKVRPDFFHRVAHLRINVPALRERIGDIAPLVGHFLEKLQREEQFNVIGLDDSAWDLLKHYRWPGNIRELEAATAAAALQAHVDGRTSIRAEDFRLSSAKREGASANFSEQVDAYKSALIQEALRKFNGNQVQAARELGLDRSTLRRILARNALSD